MIVATANQKGGSGKTTTAAAIVSGATYKGKKALAVDFDPQCTLTFIMGGDGRKRGIVNMLTDESWQIQHTAQGDLIAGNVNLAAADSTLKGRARVYGLADMLAPLRNDYDVIVIDTPPTLGTLLINGLAAADGVIVPLRAKITNIQGLYLLVQTIQKAQADYNPALKILGALFTEYNGRTNATRDVAKTIRERAAAMAVPVFKTEIRQGVAIDEAQILRKSIFEYAPKSNPARDYMAFLDELGIF